MIGCNQMTQLVPSLKLAPHETICKVRELPLAGKILVKVGEDVTENTLVAETSLPGDLQIIRLPEITGLLPETIIRHLKIKVADKIKTDQIIFERAGLFGWFKSQVKAPINGTIEFISEKSAHIGIRLEPKLMQIKAFIAGTVTKVDQNLAVHISTEATVLQGIFGVGKEKIGNLEVLPLATNQALLAENIPEDCQNKILVGGSYTDITAITKAAKLGAVGLICASIEDATLKAYLGYQLGLPITGHEEIPLTIIILEGFGRLDFQSEKLALLNKLNGRLASISGATQIRAGALRPEIIISKTPLAAEPEKSRGLVVGQKIKLIRHPYFGKTALITELPKDLHPLETKALARVLKAQLENGEIITVPRQNVELA